MHQFTKTARTIWAGDEPDTNSDIVGPPCQPPPPAPGYYPAMPNAKLLQCFASPARPGIAGRDFVIEHVSDEFTSVCPVTGHPDFGSVTVRFCPDKLCVELKSLKLYYQSFRNEGIFYEAVTNRIADDLARVMKPRWMIIITDWKGRGGIRSQVRVAIGRLPAHEKR
jgi:7-cyano-7-deazaguanine reductase